MVPVLSRLCERVLVSDPDPRLHRLLAGQGDLTDCRRSGLFPFNPDLLRHVSPIEWKNVIRSRA